MASECSSHSISIWSCWYIIITREPCRSSHLNYLASVLFNFKNSSRSTSIKRSNKWYWKSSRRSHHCSSWGCWHANSKCIGESISHTECACWCDCGVRREASSGRIIEVTSKKMIAIFCALTYKNVSKYNLYWNKGKLNQRLIILKIEKAIFVWSLKDMFANWRGLTYCCQELLSRCQSL